MNSVQENKNELEAAVRYCESAISRAQATIESMEFRQQAASKAWHEQTGRESALEHAVNDLKLKYDKMKGYADQLLEENGELEERNDELNAEVVDLKAHRETVESVLVEREDKWDDAMNENKQLQNTISNLKEQNAELRLAIEEQRTNMALMTDEIEELKAHRDELKTQLVEWRDRSMGYTKEIGELKSELEELSKAYKDSTHEEITMKKAWRVQRELVALRDDQIAMLERRLAKKENSYPFKEGDLYYVFNQLDGTWIESVWDDESERIHDSTDLPDRPHKVYFTIDQKNMLDKFKPEDD